MFQADFSQAGAATQPSPSIWKDCPGQTLVDQGIGQYVHEDFIGGTENFVNKVGLGAAALVIDADAGTTHPHRTPSSLAATSGIGLQDLAVTNTDNNAAGVFTQAMGFIVLNSGNKFWMEARVTLAALADQGLFVGLAAEAVLSRDVVADNPDTSLSVATDSLVGFLVNSAATGKVDAVIRKDAGTATNPFTDVTNSSRLGSAAGNIVAGTYVKLGLKFDGKRSISFFVNGVEIGKTTITTNSINIADPLGAIVNLKTGAAAARTMTIDWIRAAVQHRR